MASPPPESPRGNNQPPGRAPQKKQPDGEQQPRPPRLGPWLVILLIAFALWYVFYAQDPSTTGSTVRRSSTGSTTWRAVTGISDPLRSVRQDPGSGPGPAIRGGR